MNHRLSFALALGLVLTTSCKKKQPDDNGSSPKPNEGSGAMTAPANPAGSGSAATAPTPPPAKQAPKTGKDLAAAYQACTDDINTGKLDDFKANCVAADFVGHSEGMEDMKGADALIADFKGMRSAFPDLKLTPGLVMVDGRDIFAIVLIAGTQQGPMKGPGGEMPATNKKVGILMFHRLAMNDENKATEEWAYSDALTMMAQLGAMKDAGPARPVASTPPAFADPIVVSADDAKEKANIALVKKENDAFNAHKVGDVVALLTDDSVESDQTDPADVTGKAAQKKDLGEFMKAFPDVKVDVPTYYAAGDYVVALGTISGTNSGPMEGMKPTGKQISTSMATVIMVKDGKVAKTWRFHNGMSIATQLGLMPAPGDAKAGDAAGDTKPPAPSMTKKK